AGAVLRTTACRQARHHWLGPGEIPLRRLIRGLARKAALRPLLPETSVDSLRPHHPVRHGEGCALRKRCPVIRNLTARKSDSIVWEEQAQARGVALNVR